MCRNCRNNRFYDARPSGLWTPYGKESRSEEHDRDRGVGSLADVAKDFVNSCLYRIEHSFDELRVITNDNLYTLRELDLLSHPRVTFLQTHFDVLSLLLFEHHFSASSTSSTSSSSAAASSTLERYHRDKSFFHYLKGEWESAIEELKTAMKISRIDRPIDYLALAKLQLRSHSAARAHKTLRLGLTLCERKHSSSQKAEEEEVDEERDCFRQLEEEMMTLLTSLENNCYFVIEPIKLNDNKTTSKHNNFEMLSDDVLLLIFSHLNASDLVVASRVSKRWMNIALSRPAVLSVLSHHLSRDLALDLTTQASNDNRNNRNSRKLKGHVVALQKFGAALRCWHKLSLYSTLFNLLATPTFADLYPGDAPCEVKLIAPTNSSTISQLREQAEQNAAEMSKQKNEATLSLADLLSGQDGKTENDKRSWRQRQRQVLVDYEIPIEDFIDPDCDLSLPLVREHRRSTQPTNNRRNKLEKRGGRRRRRLNKLNQPDDNNDDHSNDNKDEALDLNKRCSHEKQNKGGNDDEVLPADFLMHYRIHNGAQIHLESYPPPKQPVKDGSGLQQTFVYGLNDEEEEAQRAFYHYDFTLYPITSAGMFRLMPRNFFAALASNGKVPAWYDDRDCKVMHIGRHGPRHYLTVRCVPNDSSTASGKHKAGEVTVYGIGGYDFSRSRNRGWPAYGYTEMPLGNDEQTGVFPSFTSYLERAVCPEVEKGLVNLLQKMLDIWNAGCDIAAKRSAEETAALTNLLMNHHFDDSNEEEEDVSDSVVEKAKKKLGVGKAALLSDKHHNDNKEPARLLLAGTHTPFVVRTYRDRFTTSIGTISGR
eukprot:TRINITY_DN4726_c0_g1_i1.p1 TRINITY_DN4726_c0_g1~~TRINITY_DN4726_c0_g1_i1.p1  ORF type:complete len:821 (+),score=179.38 TRINITY_DN4726_c0_g1_i1:96-2558(+)